MGKKKIFYTIQPRYVWRYWQRQGYLQAKDTDDEYFIGSYTWMKEQMKQRVPSYKGEPLIWFWDEVPAGYRTWSNDKRKKYVLLTIELDERDVLASDYNGWHWVLSGYMNCDHPKPCEDEWPYEKIFDLPFMKQEIYDEGSEQELQYTTGRIEMSSVKNVKYFTGKRRSY